MMSFEDDGDQDDSVTMRGQQGNDRWEANSTLLAPKPL